MKNNEESVQNLQSEEAIKKMQQLISHDAIGMFTTCLGEAPLQTRPMSTQEVDDEGNFWFFSGMESSKNFELKNDTRVQLFYANGSKSEYLTVYGKASISTDRKKIDALWSPMVKAWFQGGKDDPNISLIKVTPEEAHYWDTKNNKMISMLKIMTSVLTGKTMDDGVEGELNIQHTH
jgi:general stress protein 26